MGQMLFLWSGIFIFTYFYSTEAMLFCPDVECKNNISAAELNGQWKMVMNRGYTLAKCVKFNITNNSEGEWDVIISYGLGKGSSKQDLSFVTQSPDGCSRLYDRGLMGIRSTRLAIIYVSDNCIIFYRCIGLGIGRGFVLQKIGDEKNEGLKEAQDHMDRRGLKMSPMKSHKDCDDIFI